jgi:hypothetical protein
MTRQIINPWTSRARPGFMDRRAGGDGGTSYCSGDTSVHADPVHHGDTDAQLTPAPQTRKL